ncbi:signal peptidase II [Sandaracinus amylolyticus]|uniref:Lipoprotein signal peptidase n=1 Tax=Sandaracinus amylolyticus TaxID=927083 RepID=A0A0F6W3N1_9BACT|nr:signal peptidase II [Sandaracinus amylolyticus]AKF06573.1 Lipoprotein signal peptidase [Sandaracinus amylolyticus]
MAPTTTRRSNALIAACIVSTIALVALDIGTKTWAEGALSTERTGERPEVCAADDDGYIRYQRARRPGLVVIEDVFELEYAENCGAAFGLLRNAPTGVRTTIFGVAATAATLVLLWLFIQGRGGPWFAWSVPFVVSGALGNLIDRIRYGYVVDFIHWHWRDAFDYPTFNVADIAITVGVVLLLIDGFRREEPAKVDEKAAPKAKTADAGAGEQREAAGE